MKSAGDHKGSTTKYTHFRIFDILKNKLKFELTLRTFLYHRACFIRPGPEEGPVTFLLLQGKKWSVCAVLSGEQISIIEPNLKDHQSFSWGR